MVDYVEIFSYFLLDLPSVMYNYQNSQHYFFTSFYSFRRGCESEIVKNSGRILSGIQRFNNKNYSQTNGPSITHTLSEMNGIFPHLFLQIPRLKTNVTRQATVSRDISEGNG